MSTATNPHSAPARPDTVHGRVRHPLQTLRKYIRTYVLLEGLALAAIFLAAWYWLSLAVDYGMFRLFAFDWVQELQDVVPGSYNALLVRLLLLAIFLLVLFGVAFTKVALRWMREFNDAA